MDNKAPKNKKSLVAFLREQRKFVKNPEFEEIHLKLREAFPEEKAAANVKLRAPSGKRRENAPD